MMNKMSKVRKFAATAILAAGVMTLTVPAMAGTLVKTDDSMITMELPEKGWSEKVISEDAKDVKIFTNGKDSIAIRKFTADDLKDMDMIEAENMTKFAWADENYESIFQISYAEKDDLYVITASAAEKEDLPEIYKALQTIEFNVLPEEEVKENTVSRKTFTVGAADKIMYANAGSGLNIRKGYDTNSELIGTYSYAEQVHVTGYVKCDGADTGWCRIEKNGKEGFVSGKCLVNTKPEQKKEEKKEEKKEKKKEEKRAIVEGQTYTTKVNSGYLALRNAPDSTDASEFGQLWNGSTVIVTGPQTGDFVPVTVTHTASGEYGDNVDGRCGYVNAHYLQ